LSFYVEYRQEQICGTDTLSRSFAALLQMPVSFADTILYYNTSLIENFTNVEKFSYLKHFNGCLTFSETDAVPTQPIGN